MNNERASYQDIDLILRLYELRREATMRVRSWQVTQRDSTRSLPVPAGNATTAGGGAPAAGGEFGPKFTVRYCTMVSLSCCETCAPFMIM